MANFTLGDIVAGFGSGWIQHWEPDGTFVQLIETEAVDAGLFEVWGLGFDSQGRLYASIGNSASGKPIIERFTNAAVTEGQWNVFDFDAVGLFPKSITIDLEDNVFVICDTNAATIYELVKLDTGGNLVDRHVIEHSIESESNELELFLDILCDGTILYTDGYYTVFHFDFENDMQLTDFATVDPSEGLAFNALKVLPDGNIIVAMSTSINDNGPFYGIALELDFVKFWADHLDGTPYKAFRYLRVDGSDAGQDIDLVDPESLFVSSMASYVPMSYRCVIEDEIYNVTLIGAT